MAAHQATEVGSHGGRASSVWGTGRSARPRASRSFLREVQVRCLAHVRLVRYLFGPRVLAAPQNDVLGRRPLLGLWLRLLHEAGGGGMGSGVTTARARGVTRQRGLACTLSGAPWLSLDIERALEAASQPKRGFTRRGQLFV